MSAAEFVLGVFLVLGHNVFRILPNEVFILVVLGFLSFRLRDRSWSAIGFRRPDSWLLLLTIAFAAAGLRILVGTFVVDPLTAWFWPPAATPGVIAHAAGNAKITLFALGLVWTFAAFGEEIAYRGYLLTRAADVGNRSKAAWLIAMILVSVLFGYGHYYKGPAGVVDSTVAGLIRGSAYLLAGRNLWASVLAHGFIDTVAVVVAYLGVDQ